MFTHVSCQESVKTQRGFHWEGVGEEFALLVHHQAPPELTPDIGVIKMSILTLFPHSPKQEPVETGIISDAINDGQGQLVGLIYKIIYKSCTALGLDG